MSEFKVIDLTMERCCEAEPLFTVKVHRRSDSLLGGQMYDVCHEHLGYGTQKALQALLDDPDVYAVTLLLP